MSNKFGNITISSQQLKHATKAYAKHLGGHAASKSEKFLADRVLRASGHHRVEYVEIPMDSPLVDFLLFEKEGKLLQPVR